MLTLMAISHDVARLIITSLLESSINARAATLNRGLFRANQISECVSRR